MSIIFPGESAPANHVNLKLGPGLLQVSSIFNDASDGETPRKRPVIIATKAGELKHSVKGSQWWIESNSRRYVPVLHESVVGLITQRLGEAYRVDIGSAHHASLDGLAFEGATKRSKPNLKVGSLVYARVSLAHKDMEPELECFGAQTHKAEGFGELKGGFVVKCSLEMCRCLLNPKHFLLPMLGRRFPLDAAIGMNGRVWVSAKNVKEHIIVSRCIEAVDPDGGGMNEDELKKFLHTLGV
ncbi:hypothetical protein AMATHDRAFT_45664 [Amanita thiersii Skay4041]|uniref:Ribosomal RNA-processing protein 40 n=1 Tax=Amanita thiersii Skay4041 TaxID=703135 RepID=A0A2A9NY25_9AGAR|nr:hypothetical protein AMATHDRAFT_45664 [Amanita thiersii Skay4041]